ncbi:hypothetical protein EXIGLDRAFT_838188 [Exidia glandulosa HHB12029]|uniref:Uncharacterized protein n=1 Tax=Exidia glandulosa HHB12029 TaxID=1314781 RepID=A0A166AA05_EXIGL|nr:hypothetical protein EXIGLDRAFT_838188 [Exidia glandulosa HHB12029]
MSVSSNDLTSALQYHGHLFILTPQVFRLDFDAPGSKLEEIVQGYARLHRGCPCGRSINPQALWKVDIPFGQDALTGLEDFDPATARLLDPAASVESVFGGGNFMASPPAINLVITLDPSGTSIPFRGIRRLRGDACRVSGIFERKSIPTLPQYSTFVEQPGRVFIDRSEYVKQLFGEDSDARIPIIRREAGYGKTAFVSLLTTWFRASGSPDMFPERRTDYTPELYYLTLVVDFADLAPRLPEGHSGTHAEIMVACKAFLADSIGCFYETHAEILGNNRPARTDSWMHTYKGLGCTLILELRTRLVVAFDNYTAPFERVSGMRAQDTEFEIWAQILGPVIHDFDSVVWRGFITGRPLGDILPFTSRPIFVERTRDITDDPGYLGMIGFTYDDVLHLGNAACSNSYDLPAAMKLAKETAALQPENLKQAVYSAQKITSVLSRLLDGFELDDILADKSLLMVSKSFSTDSQLCEKSTARPDTTSSHSLGSPSHLGEVKESVKQERTVTLAGSEQEDSEEDESLQK